jgi:hypothetical protein
MISAAGSRLWSTGSTSNPGSARPVGTGGSLSKSQIPIVYWDRQFGEDLSACPAPFEPIPSFGLVRLDLDPVSALQDEKLPLVIHASFIGCRVGLRAVTGGDTSRDTAANLGDPHAHRGGRR